MELLIQIGFFVGLLVVGLVFGRMAEKRHFRELAESERQLARILVFNERKLPADGTWRRTQLVTGSVVIAEDYFKRIAASLASLVGGRLGVYESLMDRGRREAIVRMKRDAQKIGATMVFNVRLETSSLSEDHRRQALFSAEFLAYGTALVPANAARTPTSDGAEARLDARA
jgi:uncharacterized protein YbjQ (UPF0145 family)